MKNEIYWLTVGFCGQGLFSLRFIVQWWQSERAGRSVMPVTFWYFSIAGGIVLLIYAFHRLDPVFTIGQLAGLLIYFRNLYLVKHPQQPESIPLS